METITIGYSNGEVEIFSSIEEAENGIRKSVIDNNFEITIDYILSSTNKKYSAAWTVFLEEV